MKYVFATALTDFRVSERLSSPIEIKKNLYLTNNPDHTARFLSISHIVSIGTLEAKPLTDGSVVVYLNSDSTDPSQGPVEVINFLREVQAFLMAAWLKEDNSANCELAFAFGQDIEHIHSNALDLHYRLHSGEKRVMTVNGETITEICAIHSKYFQGIRQQDFPDQTTFQKTVDRLSRAIRFLQQARGSDDLGLKIANYCSFFEALLSTSSTELSHQLSERVAFFLSDQPQERLRLFREVKKAYGVRSKIVHGDILSSSTISSLSRVSEQCDKVARALLLKVVYDDDLVDLFNKGSSEELDAHMLNLIFGISRSATEPR